MMKKFFYGWIMAGTILGGQLPLAARTVREWPKFEQWVDQNPTQEILGMSLFEHPLFRQGIEKLMPVARWNEIWENYHFNQVKKLDHGLFITGNHSKYPGDSDVAIWIDMNDATIGGICKATAMRAYLAYPNDGNPNNEPRPLHQTIVSIMYYTQEGKTVFYDLDEFDFCGRGEPQKIINLWQERSQSSAPTAK